MRTTFAGRWARRYVVAFAVCVGSAAYAAAEPPAQAPRHSTTSSDDAMASDGLRPAERAFLRNAAELSQQHFRLGQLLVGRASSAELRNLGQQLVIDHREIRQSLDALIRRKGVISRPPTEAALEQFAALAEIPTPEFDREVVLFMAASANTMVRMFETMVATARDADVRDFAGSSLAALRAESNELRVLTLAQD